VAIQIGAAASSPAYRRRLAPPSGRRTATRAGFCGGRSISSTKRQLCLLGGPRRRQRAFVPGFRAWRASDDCCRPHPSCRTRNRVLDGPPSLQDHRAQRRSARRSARAVNVAGGLTWGELAAGFISAAGVMAGSNIRKQLNTVDLRIVYTSKVAAATESSCDETPRARE